MSEEERDVGSDELRPVVLSDELVRWLLPDLPEGEEVIADWARVNNCAILLVAAKGLSKQQYDDMFFVAESKVKSVGDLLFESVGTVFSPDHEWMRQRRNRAAR
jgi:hypothetical protein